MESLFRQRIGFNGDLKELSKIICRDFDLGRFIACSVVLVGYEDFNFSLETTKRKFFVKVFSNTRTLDDCKRNVAVVVKLIDAGVFVPKLYPSEQGYLHILKIDQSALRLCVMDFTEGKDFFTSRTTITHEDMRTLARQAAVINSLNIKPSHIYDSWAIVNFPREFEKKSEYLEQEDLELIQPLIEGFQSLTIETLPHCFVHGDILRTNVIKDNNAKIWIVDFSVSNYCPRIQELAVLACDILFNKDNKIASEQNLNDALEEYQKTITLTSRELESLPLYIKLAHAMHALCANYEKKVNKNNSKENEYFLTIGRSGLRQMD
ncbi:MAG: phosphotransferase [Candidatus Woesearchaeota archaeon]